MAQLIQMRQQIRAIESIKKITHAMRLISMSAHSQLSHKAPLIENYKNELFKLTSIVQASNKDLKSSILNPTEVKITRNLIILIGSQKGLAGTFNTALFRFFEKKINSNYKNFEFITVGKRATDFIKKHEQPISSYDHFTILTLFDIAHKIFETIIKANPIYTNITIYSNYPKSFFAQIPQKYLLIPSQQETKSATNLQLELENYVWEQSIQDIYETLTKEYLHLSIQSVLFNSLLAEQAARFQSMDNATRNAEELLETLKLQYNKLRQTKITKEISELSVTLI